MRDIVVRLTWRSWLDGVLRMVLDVESSIQSKCIEVVGSAIFSNLVSYDHSSTDHHRMAWSLLDVVADASNVDLWSARNHSSYVHSHHHQQTNTQFFLQASSP